MFHFHGQNFWQITFKVYFQISTNPTSAHIFVMKYGSTVAYIPSFCFVRKSVEISDWHSIKQAFQVPYPS
jgi:hypothetical protein